MPSQLKPSQLKKSYAQGKNISEILRQEKGIDYNTPEMIETSYDIQTGSYTAAMNKPTIGQIKRDASEAIAKEILSLCQPDSILEAGAGEATTFSGVLKNLTKQSLNKSLDSYAFDISWSRVAYAREWLKKEGFDKTVLNTGDLNDIPYLDNSFDIVYTMHAIEPNGGSEEKIIKELYRVTKKYLILIEPGYELADDNAKKRMGQLGYCKNLKGIASSLGYKVMEQKLFPLSPNPNNPSAITIIQKQEAKECTGEITTINRWACPQYKTPLVELGGMLYSPEALVVYPVIDDIPCLRIGNGITASKFEEIINMSE